MAKFYGPVGFAEPEEMNPGVYIDHIVERKYYGDFIKNAIRVQSSNQVNDNIVIANKISIVADPYANEKFHAMRYVEYMGTKWKITDVEVQYPRLILTMGGVWNGQ